MKIEYLILIILIAYFYKISIKDTISESKNRKFVEENLKLGSYVISSSGIIGEVIDMDDLSVIIVSGNRENRSYIRIEKDSIKKIIDRLD
ncbi:MULTISPECIES: preprotein translocase subunit YajC [Anaerococcus]|uniref:preprotein translocase subunit YajC n=1 Tax=Anaerococcus TaxID=165779 RepID=UPI0027BAD816|nr:MULTISPECIES: preprotein translocase subunit YajC [Anaerococcus]MDU2557574.1 preprotein translocase subunit YajC [Anaerococcus prevotii]MDU2585189.1 preprotein translocase subunit YajC [Anaerococcus prevotii]MDU3136330.1 preprotein translocase subunit YajC [Anaerococcus prevotii]